MKVAGVTSLIKSMLMFQKKIIPPHAGIKGRINHKFAPLDKMNIHIADSPIPFEAHNSRRKILLNNFNATVSFFFFFLIYLYQLVLGTLHTSDLANICREATHACYSKKPPSHLLSE